MNLHRWHSPLALAPAAALLALFGGSCVEEVPDGDLVGEGSLEADLGCDGSTDTLTLALRDSSADAFDEKAHWQATPAEGSAGGFLFRVSDEGPEVGHQVTVTFPQEPGEGEQVCTALRLGLTLRGLSESGAPGLTYPQKASEYTWSIDFIGAPFGSGLQSRGEGQLTIGQEGPPER